MGAFDEQRDLVLMQDVCSSLQYKPQSSLKHMEQMD